MLPISAMADLAPHSFKIDDEYEIVQSYETSEKSEDGSSGSSSGHDVLLERVIAISENGIEFEYDVPTIDEFSSRVKKYLLEYPWLVCESQDRAKCGRRRCRRCRRSRLVQMNVDAVRCW